MTLTLISENKVAGGWHKRFKHVSSSNKCEMTFAIFLPPQVEQGQQVPVLYWLSGLTCTDENFMQKAGAFLQAAELGLAIVAPDTSPRGEEVADEPDSYDFGKGAGFYVDATQAPYHHHYNMYSYVTKELPALVQEHFPISDKKSISGHSMGGHGALTIGLKHPTQYQSISAFAPICNPMAVPWGTKAFTQYLGEDEANWKQYDASELLAKSAGPLNIKIDQGESDDFLNSQLKPEVLLQAAEQAGVNIEYRLHPGYDHSYFFISSFINQHLAFHRRHL